MFSIRFFSLYCGQAALLASLAASAFAQTARHVVVFGVDGLSSRGIHDAATPTMHQLMREGTWTLDARAVIPTVSSPNWAAIIDGAAPHLTGVTSNDWQPDHFDIAPACEGSPHVYPTIFGRLRKVMPQAKIGIFTDWNDFVRLSEPGAADTVVKTNEHAADAVNAAIRFIGEQHPLLTFIHVDHVDDAGHTHGWYGPEYNKAVEKADEYLHQVLDALDRAGMRKDTVVLVTADHGGHEKKHGAMAMSDVIIPWIASGPGIPVNHHIGVVSTTQTAPTITLWLGVSPDPCWLSSPVLAAVPVAPTGGTAH